MGQAATTAARVATGVPLSQSDSQSWARTLHCRHRGPHVRRIGRSACDWHLGKHDSGHIPDTCFSADQDGLHRARQIGICGADPNLRADPMADTHGQ